MSVSEQRGEVAAIDLVTPDGKHVLKRLPDDYEFAPGKLALFGGRMQSGESPEECLERRLVQDSTLSIGNLAIQPTFEFDTEPTDTVPWPRHFYTFESQVEDANLADIAEAYTLNELDERDDLADSARQWLEFALSESQ